MIDHFMISGCANDHIDNQESIEDPDPNHEQELVEYRNEEILDDQVDEERADPENVQDDHDHGVDDNDYGLDDYDDYDDDYYDDGDDYWSDWNYLTILGGNI